jgi:hypothetical protein
MGKHLQRPVRIVSFLLLFQRGAHRLTPQAIVGAGGFIGQYHLQHLLQEKDCGELDDISDPSLAKVFFFAELAALV